jgi:hypothetical protein
MRDSMVVAFLKYKHELPGRQKIFCQLVDRSTSLKVLADLFLPTFLRSQTCQEASAPHLVFDSLHDCF